MSSAAVAGRLAIIGFGFPRSSFTVINSDFPGVLGTASATRPFNTPQPPRAAAIAKRLRRCDRRHGRRKNRIGIEPAGVDDDRIACRLERSHGAAGITPVALLHVPQNAAIYNFQAAFPQLLKAPRGTNSTAAVTNSLIGACGQTTVPISRPSSTAPGASPDGCSANRRWNDSRADAYRRHRRYLRGRTGRNIAAQFVPRQVGVVQRLGGPDGVSQPESPRSPAPALAARASAFMPTARYSSPVSR